MNNNQLLSNYYLMHRDELVSFIAVRTLDAIEAEDIVQDIFLRLLRGQHLITPQTLPSLLHTMARHAVSDYYRRRHVYEVYEHYIQTSDFRPQTSDDDTESIFSAQQLMERMERSLARLPKACCEIYRLHIYDGMKVSDIAQELSLPYKQVENRLGQARKAVRQQLRECV
ncbi:MAG: sigma-70 family RNA polymerase sigma factor [Prevotella sp.]|nr:sigma-70 family RNA polymerase sigma factor [Prevotella sp.]